MYALRIIRLNKSLDRSNDVANVIGRQLLRSGTSVGAHWREAHRARSTAEFISKLEVAIQELDESSYWIELLVHAEIVKRGQLFSLTKETEELMSILVASTPTAKSNRTK